MTGRRLLIGAAAITIPMAATVSTAPAWSAAQTTVAPGSITCSYGTTAAPTTMTFSPPLKRSPGTPVTSTKRPYEVVTISRASLGGCKSVTAPKVTTGRATAAVKVYLAGTSLGGNRWDVGNCLQFQQMSWARFGSQLAWSGSVVPIANTSLTTGSSSQSRTLGRLGFIALGTDTGSFAGVHAKVTAYLSAKSTNAVTATCGGGTTSVASATVDASLSTMRLGS